MVEMDLSDRMKEYEGKYRNSLVFENPDDALVVRVDGKAFHTYTKGARIPFDSLLQDAMNNIAIDLCSEVQGAVLAYVQSDEVSVIARPFKKESSSVWFDGNVQKICSITSAMAAVRMTVTSPTIFGSMKEALFDSRAFVIPANEVVNYLIWRQSDALRNSVQMLARSHFSHRKLMGKSCDEMKDLLRENKAPWENIDLDSQRGRTIVRRVFNEPVTFLDKRTKQVKQALAMRSKWIVDGRMPLFVEDRKYVEAMFNASSKEVP